MTQVQAKTPTIYANVVNVRATSSELMMDFGYVVSPPENAAGPQELVPEVRVIMTVNAARKFGQILLKIAQQQDQADSSNNTNIAEKA